MLFEKNDRPANLGVAAKEAFRYSYCRHPLCCVYPPKLNYCALSSIALPICTVLPSPEQTGDMSSEINPLIPEGKERN